MQSNPIAPEIHIPSNQSVLGIEVPQLNSIPEIFRNSAMPVPQEQSKILQDSD